MHLLVKIIHYIVQYKEVVITLLTIILGIILSMRSDNSIVKKIFGGINLTWPKVIIMAIIVGIYTAVMALLPVANDTSFSDLKVTFEVWIFFGIFIIMNSKSAKDSS